MSGLQPRKAGSAAEDEAARFLQEQGFTIITRRFKARHGEIDLIALEGEVLVFVEVKSTVKAERSPEEAIGDRKRERLFAAAEEYLAGYEGPERPVRYDVVTVTPTGIRLHREAFWP
ncbi:MAG: YraN family protein [Armatimonadetes bacterium]|nr:YraN family protein [Armatimonadota bacterium]